MAEDSLCARVPQWLAEVQSADLTMHQCAARALGQDLPTHGEAIVAWLGDESERMRIAATYALGQAAPAAPPAAAIAVTAATATATATATAATAAATATTVASSTTAMTLPADVTSPVAVTSPAALTSPAAG